MAKCKQCDTDIFEGEDLCQSCIDKNSEDNSSESYLDSLLESMLEDNKTKDSETTNRIRKNKVQPMNKASNDNYENDAIDMNEFEEEQDLDLNNIFDFMDMVGNTDEIVETEETTETEEIAEMEEMVETEEAAGTEEMVEAGETEENIDGEVMLFDEDEDIELTETLDEVESESIDENQIVALEELSEEAMEDGSLLKGESDDFNELLNFLSAEEEENIDELSLNNMIQEEEMILEEPIITEEPIISEASTILEDMIISKDDMFEGNLSSTFDSGSDIGDVFNHALSGVDALEDSNDLADIVPEELQLGAVEKEKKEKKRAIFKEIFNKSKKVSQEEPSIIKKKESKKKKPKKKSNKVVQAAEGDKGEKPKQKKSLFGFIKKDKNKVVNEQNKRKQIKLIKKKKSKVEEVEIDTGRINQAAAVIIFMFFLSLAGVVIIGKDIVSYSNSISRATTEFERQRYTYAYKEIRGVEVKPADTELYDKIMTVMYVNKQLNSYYNYSANKAYPQALDSLLKGLQRYDKYIDLARSLGIEEDLNYIRIQIQEELDQVYNLTESEAMDIIEIKDNKENKEYSILVYQTANDTMNESE